MESHLAKGLFHLNVGEQASLGDVIAFEGIEQFQLVGFIHSTESALFAFLVLVIQEIADPTPEVVKHVIGS